MAARPRLSEVAARAGVSEKTVSNVINNYPHVTARTREKVEQALAELNYRVNLSARSLASGRTGFIALAVPGLSNPYFATLAGHVIQAAASQQWTVLIEQTDGDRNPESEVVGGSTSYLVDGIVLHPESLTSADLAARADSTPLVLLGEKPLNHVADRVVADNIAAAAELTRHLLDGGRTRIATIGLEPDSELMASALRSEGVRTALAAAGRTLDPELTITVEEYQRADGAAAMAALLALPTPPDAVICFNDILAMGALSQLNRARVAVPDQIAIAGFDDIEEAPFASPSLTTIKWDTKRIAQEAVRLLAERHGSSEALPQREIVVGYELVVRESTSPAVRAAT